MSERVRVLDTLTEIPRRSWDDLARGAGYYSSHDWLLANEAHPSATARYFVVESADGRPVVGLPVYDVARETNDDYHPARLGLPDDRFRVLGSRRGYRGGPLVVPDLAPAALSAALTTLAHALRSELDGPSGWFYVPSPSLAHVQALSPGPVGDQPLGHEAWIDVGPGGLEEHLARTPPKRRREMGRERRRFLDAGYAVGTETTASVADEAGRLLALLEQKHGNDKGVDAMTGYMRVLAGLPDPGEVVTCRAEGQLVGFCHYFLFAGTLWARCAGFDYARLRGAFEYFNLCVYELLERAATEGCTAVHLGTGSLQAKTNRGARLEALWGVRAPART